MLAAFQRPYRIGKRQKLPMPGESGLCRLLVDLSLNRRRMEGGQRQRVVWASLLGVGLEGEGVPVVNVAGCAGAGAEPSL
jgi:hypothetical protein